MEKYRKVKKGETDSYTVFVFFRSLGEADSRVVKALALKLQGAQVRYPCDTANFSQLTAGGYESLSAEEGKTERERDWTVLSHKAGSKKS